MDSKSLVFLGLIGGSRQYRIPSFQRAYSWEKEDREALWLDVLTQYELLHSVWGFEESEREQALSQHSTHYLGTIVLSGPSSLGVPKSDIIDGQQRITSLLLAICSLRDLWGKQLANSDGIAAAEAKYRSLSNKYLVNDGEVGADRYRVLPLSKDAKAFRAIVDSTGSTQLTAESLALAPSDSDRMLRAYKFFRTEMSRRAVSESNIQLKRFSHMYPLKLGLLEQTIAHRLSVIAIETKNNDDTNAIFESLNAKGRPLTQLDLLRNYVFMTLGSKADQVLAEDWRPMEETYLPDSRDMEAFVWADVVSRGANVLQRRTYRTVQSEIREAGATAAAAENYVKRLRRRAPYFRQIVDPSEVGDSGLRSSLESLAAAGGKTARPVLLWLFEERADERCDLDEVVRCVGHLESFVTRRFLCGMPPNNLNSMFGIMLSRLNGAGPVGPASGTVEERLLSALLSVPKDWPDDDALTEGVRDRDFYHNGDARQRTHVLRSLDLGYGYDLKPGYEESDRSIEHIFPQTKNSEVWESDLEVLGDEFQAVRDRLLHTLGNLTVVAPADNSLLGTKRFSVKAEIFKSLGYKITRHVPDFATSVSGELFWGADAIRDRSEDLAQRAAGIWCRPAQPSVSTDVEDVEPPVAEFSSDLEDPVPFTSSINENSDAD